MENYKLVETFSEFKEFKNIDREAMMRIIEDVFRGMLNKKFDTDTEDFIDIIVNVDKAVLTGAKLEDKYYRHHTGWIGGLKEVKYRTLMEQRPEFAMELAVKGMLPKNSLGRSALTRLKLYTGPEHKNAAQKPEAWVLD